MTTLHIALLRGINVGRAKRIAMADLRTLLSGLGCQDVRTLLNSGNAVFEIPAGKRVGIGPRIEQALVDDLGVSSKVIVLTAAELATIVAENTLVARANNFSRLLVCVLREVKDRKRLKTLTAGDFGSEALVVGKRAAYLWCPESILKSPLFEAVDDVLGDAYTARNWATITKLQALAMSDRGT